MAYLASVTSVKDRTTEFAAIVESARSRQSPLASTSGAPGSARKRSPRTEFARSAAAIGHDINHTAAKLEKLTKLVKKKSLFDDRPVEIQELTYIIKQDLAALNQSIDKLRHVMMSQKGQNPSKQADDHSNSVVVSLQSKLASTSSAFKDILEARTQNMKAQKDRREQFSAGVAASAVSNKPSSSALYKRSEKNGGSSPTSNGSAEFVTIDLGTPLLGNGMQQLQLQQQDSYADSRHQEIQNIESTINQLGTIFQQLASLVAEQGEQLQRIDANVEDVERNVEEANKQLLKYIQTFGSNRALMLKIFGVLILFFVVFIVFFA